MIDLIGPLIDRYISGTRICKTLDSKPFCFHSLQALGIPFRSLGTSEPNASYRAYQILNTPSIEHMHCKMDEQAEGFPCQLHPAAGACFPGESQSPQIAVFGTPCPPFSRQRAKRFVKNSVEDHSAFSVTFTDTYKWLLVYQPVTAIMEQVLGFDCKDSVDSEGPTPYARPYCQTDKRSNELPTLLNYCL